MPTIPIEYVLFGAVGLILLGLLVFALTGKRTTRVVQRTAVPANDELTKQVARAATALEALLAHLKTATPASQVIEEERLTVVAQKAPEAPEPIVVEPVIAEPVIAEAAAAEQPKPRRVKLSMFGR